MKTCIAALTRGYQTIDQYQTLIQRNNAILEHLRDRSIPLLFFHEGNILPDHQRHIARQTPALTMHFVDITRDGRAFRREKEAIPHDYSTVRWGGMGYRHMCSFWFVDFWLFLQEWDLMVRIDEDCLIRSSLDDVIERMRTAPEPQALLTAHMMDDRDFVCEGMNQFTLNFMYEETNGQELPRKNPPSGPYTNFIVMRLDRLRNHERLMYYIQAVDHSNHIYQRRWGDLPLWGEVITYILGDDALILDTTLQYYHISHGICVNYDDPHPPK
jgi:hypothetical protein